MMYIFMVGMAGSGAAMNVYAGEGPIVIPGQQRSPQSKSIFSILKRSSSRSSSVAVSGDEKSDIIVGSLESTSSIQTSSSSSSSSSLSVTSSQSSPSKAGNRLSRAMSRLSMRRTSVPAVREQEEWIVVEDETKRKSAESLEEKLAQKRCALDSELDNAQIAVIPGILHAARTIFQEAGYSSQTVAQCRKDPVADIQNTLNHLKNVLNNYLEAKEEYERKVEINFERAGDFCPKGLYLYLGCTIQEGKSKTCDDIKTIIARKKAKATTDAARWMLRQTEYIFDNSESKRLYDACLTGQDDSFERKEQEHYWFLYKIVGLSYAAIEEAVHEYNEALKEYQSHHDKSPDLANQALTLNLDVKTNIQ
jgi:hypothetical protein